ncbi:MAG: cytochrome c biogenesis protein DipZ [Patescibacteria group bacterium]
MFVLIVFAFIAGIVTILSPCILPVLPIVLSSSIGGGKKRPFGVITGFIVSFTFFTLALTAIVNATGISADVLRYVAIILIGFFGLLMLFPKLLVAWEGLLSKLSTVSVNNSNSNGFGGGFLVGLSLGLIWTPCAGPILASVITLAATSQVTFGAVLITLAYSLGTAIPMTLVIFGGRALLNKVPVLLKNSAKIQRIFGVIVILMALAIGFNLDRKLQTFIVEKFPSYGAGLTKIEQLDVVKERLGDTGMITEEAYNKECVEAPDFTGGGEWLNSDPLNIEGLKGKVVLVDFWTYTCINCIRTMPYITGWYDNYKDNGLVVIGVHTPEFEFEKKTSNVASALKDYGVNYPVVQDNDYKIWRNYQNRYWPAKYFVDKKGCVRKTHFGEGDYEESEEFIRKLLEEDGEKLDKDLLGLGDYDVESRTPETYLGYARIENFASNEKIQLDKYAQYSLPEILEKNQFGYSGTWNVGEESAMTKAGASLELNFTAKEVFLVMRSDKQASAKVYLDNKLVNNNTAGIDVKNGEVMISEDKLYKLVKLESAENHVLKLEFLNEGAEVYAFTFG